MNRGRIVEILLMPGFVLASLPFVSEVPPRELALRATLLFVVSLLLVIAVYAVNSYFGFETDRLNPRLKDDRLSARGLYLPIAAFSLLLSLGAFWWIRPVLAPLALGCFVLWTIYSLPRGAKSRPVWGTAIHFLSQVLQFHLGFLAFRDVTAASVLVSIFFAMIFSCGHLMHELKDYDSDLAAGIRTNAVVFGRLKIVRFYRVALFALALYWIALFAFGVISLKQFLPFCLATLAHAAVAARLSDGALLRNESFQRGYRAIYLLAGLATLSGL